MTTQQDIAFIAVFGLACVGFGVALGFWLAR